MGLEQHEELLMYEQIMEHVNRDINDDNRVWKFKEIYAHEGPLSKGHPSYKGSSYNVLIEWENSEKTSEPLSLIASDNPVSCTECAIKSNLLDKASRQS
jgi:hypothetical protein